MSYPTAEDYLRVPEDELKADIKPTGFFNQKALSIRESCRRIVEVYDGKVPDTMEELTTLREEAEARMRELQADTDRVRGERRELLEDIRVRGATLLEVADAADTREPDDEQNEPESVDEIERVGAEPEAEQVTKG